MSSCLILQTKDNICIGADTALSVIVGNKLVRESNDGKKLFEIGKDIVFCSGDMYYVPDIIKNIKTEHGYVDVEHISKYLKKIEFRKCPILDTPSIEVIVCRVIDGVSYVYTLGVENNFDVVTRTINQRGIQIWVGGIHNEKCVKIATNEIEKSNEIITIYKNTYKKMACPEIGGSINVYYLNSNGYQKIIDNYDLKDGYDAIYYGVCAPAIVGNLIAGDKMFIGNKENNVLITGDGITIKNGLIQSANYKAGKTGSMLDLTNGTFDYAGGKLTYKNSTLTVKGNVTADELIATNKGKIANFNISKNKICTDDVEFDDSTGIYFVSGR